MPSAQVLSAIELLHEAALLPARWSAALDTMAQACGAAGATLYRLPAGPERALTTPNLAEATGDYAATWWRYDSRAPHLASAVSERPLIDRDLSSDEDRRRDPFYQEFLKRYDLGDFAAVSVAPMPGMRFAMTVERGSGPLEPSELQTFSLLSRHAAQAVAATIRIQAAEHFATELAAATEKVACGMVFLDDQGRVRFANPSAERMFGDGLATAGGRIEAARPADQARLDRLIGSALPGSDVPAGESLFVARPSGKAPLVVQAHPLRPQGRLPVEQLGLEPGGAVLLIYDLATEPSSSLQRDLERLGLTRAEARVAELVGQGHSVKEAAERLGIAEGTARTQLKSVYSRLGIGRQSELAILITRLGDVRI